MSATRLLASHSRFSRFSSQTSDSVEPSHAPPPSPSYRHSSHKTSFYLFTCKTPSLSLGPSGQRPGGSKSPGLTGCRPGPGWLPRKAERPTREGFVALGLRGGNWRGAQRGPGDLGAGIGGAPPRRHCGLPSPQRPAPPKPDTWVGFGGWAPRLSQNSGLQSVCRWWLPNHLQLHNSEHLLRVRIP